LSLKTKDMNRVKRIYIIPLLAIMLCSALGNCMAQSSVKQKDEKMAWWREARFGLFIHWGLYSVAAGEHQGKPIIGIGEWIQHFGEIPNSEYSQYLDGFNPVEFDADKWVKLAKQAGTKYIVITAKHHEGFCLYPSDYSNFDISSTPYKKDILKQLAEACKRHDMIFGLYYSHRQDWHEPDATVPSKEWEGHFDDSVDMNKTDLNRYIREKAIPQVKEILTRYGEIGVIWFDTPADLTREQSQVFVDAVHGIQPNCIINGRVGHSLGDYEGLGDNEMPCSRATLDLEMVATMNHTWGYKKNDHEWKDKRDILLSLIECASRGINYMVNIGPRADGIIPQPSINILEYIGCWMDINNESIYGTSGNPFPDNFPWGMVTAKGNKLYLHVDEFPEDSQIELKGMDADIEKARFLDNNGTVTFKNGAEKTLTLEYKGDKAAVPVVCLELNKKPVIDPVPNQYAGIISIPISTGEIIPGKEGTLHFGNGGQTENFAPGFGSVKVPFQTNEAGRYKLKIYTSRHWRKSFADGNRVSIECAGTSFKNFLLRKDEQLKNVRENSYPEVMSEIGIVEIPQKGNYEISIQVDQLGTYSKKRNYGEDLTGESSKNIRVLRFELIKLE